MKILAPRCENRFKRVVTFPPRGGPENASIPLFHLGQSTNEAGQGEFNLSSLTRKAGCVLCVLYLSFGKTLLFVDALRCLSGSSSIVLTQQQTCRILLVRINGIIIVVPAPRLLDINISIEAIHK